jgi:hypothetical protein
VRRE